MDLQRQLEFRISLIVNELTSTLSSAPALSLSSFGLLMNLNIDVEILWLDWLYA